MREKIRGDFKQWCAGLYVRTGVLEKTGQKLKARQLQNGARERKKGED